MSLVEDYVRSLPRGLASYPEQQAKGSLVRTFRDHARPEEREALPPELRPLFDRPPLASSWLPEVHFLCFVLAARQTRFTTDEAHLAYTRRLNSELFATPLYRIIFFVASPRMLLNGASRRWAQFHQGTQLTIVESGPRFCEIRLAFPPKLFTDLHVRVFASAFEAAFEAAGAKECRTVSTKMSTGEGRYRMEWK